MKQILSPGLVKRSLSSHSWIGLLIGAFMYLTCLSGTLVVLYPDFERWEQPDVPEYTDYDPKMFDQAYSNLLETGATLTHHMYVNMPTDEMPRANIATDEGGWFLAQDGSLAQKVDHEWTHLIIKLHNYLHLPATFGMIVVSIFGILLCSLIVSGFLSHPSIFKDAFNFRRQGSLRLENVDLHNRLSVWGAPFHLVIAATGAFFGLAGLFGIVAGGAFYNGGIEEVTAAIYGAEPELQQETRQPAIGSAIAALSSIDPGAPPMYVTIEEADEPEHQYMIIGTRHEDRLIWAEQHRFDSAGNYIDKIGFTDGDAGRQAVFSVYRLHFGHFGGWLIKALYIIFGLALTIVSVSGINIWLARRKTRDYLNNLWAGFVWGAPAALSVTAITQILLGIPSTIFFWLGLIVAMALAQWLNNEASIKVYLKFATGVLLTLLLVGYLIRFGNTAFGPAALGINIAIAVVAALFLLMGALQRKTSVNLRATSDN